MKHSVTDLNATNIVDFIGSIFEKRGGEEYLGEPVTMGQHMLQGATMAEQSRETCLLYTSPSPRDGLLSRMPSSA